MIIPSTPSVLKSFHSYGAMLFPSYSIVDNYQKVVKLKLQNPDLKISLAIGGWTHGVEKFTHL
jgi:GH18 family chitinase